MMLSRALIGLLIVLAPSVMTEFRDDGTIGGPPSPFEEAVWTSGPVGAIASDHGYIPPPRGALILAPGEDLVLEGRHDFTSVTLGSGSKLHLENCSLVVRGDGASDPYIRGSPEVFDSSNSTISVLGRNGTGLTRDRGENASVKLTGMGLMSLLNTSILVKGGMGWESGQVGSYFDIDLSGHRFGGGNTTFSVRFRDRGGLRMRHSDLLIMGGKGADAPDAEDIDGDEYGLPGGYTTGGNLSSYVGAGGHAFIEFLGPSSDAVLEDSRFEVLGGRGGEAGDAGQVVWMGDKAFNVPVPSGGYTSGDCEYYKEKDAGYVKDMVGSGGPVGITFNFEDISMKYVGINSNAGGGGCAGHAGRGGALGGNWPYSFTYTKCGSGGGGYSGGSAPRPSGENGGNIFDRVGSGGGSMVNITAGHELITDSITIFAAGGGGGRPTGGGVPGAINQGDLHIDGGGGGGGGFSGGGGAGLDSGFYDPVGGAAGFVGEEVGRGGNCTIMVQGDFVTASGSFIVDGDGGLAYALSSVDGQSGEVGGIPMMQGGEGGKGAIGRAISGTEVTEVRWPSPCPLQPVDGGYMKDITTPFKWTAPSTFYESMGPVSCEVRLLASANVSDVVQTMLSDSTETVLLSDPGDGCYYWTIRTVIEGNASAWSRPRAFIIDRVPPELEGPEGTMWVPSFDPIAEFRAFDAVSGIDAGDLRCSVGPPEAPPIGWEPVGSEDVGGGWSEVMVMVPTDERGYTVWVKASDRAGNGPVVGGPYPVKVDGTPPVISNVTPSGWSSGSLTLDLDAFEEGSGLGPWLLFTAWVEGSSAHVEAVVGIIEAWPGHFAADRPIFLTDGDWDYRIRVSDIAGNEGVSDVVHAPVDCKCPLIELIVPCEGGWTNRSQPAISMNLTDQGGGYDRINISIMSCEGVLEWAGSVEVPGLGEATIALPAALKEGLHSLSISCIDRAGNGFSTGPREFGIDTTPPRTTIIGPAPLRWSGPEPLTVSVKEALSGLVRIDIEELRPVDAGWEVVGTAAFDQAGGPFDGTISLDPGPGLDVPVKYFRARSVDGAGNQGPWSPIWRIDRGPLPSSLEATSGPFFGPGSPVILKLIDPLCLNVSTLEMRVLADGEAGVWSPIWDVVYLENASSSAGLSIEGPTTVDLTLWTLGHEQNVRVEVRYRDLLPLSEKRGVLFVDLIWDGAPPALEVECGTVSLTNPVSVDLNFSDEGSGTSVEFLTVEVGKGNGSRPGSSNGPSWSSEMEGSGRLLINLTWGKRTEIMVRLADRTGNIAEKAVSVRATRPPEMVIGGAPENGRVKAGKELLLYAAASDPDGDRLTVLWYVDGEEAWNGSAFKVVLDPGEHVIKAIASDGDLSVEDRVEISAEEGSGGRGGALLLIVFAAIAALLIMAAGALFIMFRGRLREDGEGQDREEGVEDWGEDDNVYDSKDASVSENGKTAPQCDICLRPLPRGARMTTCRCGAKFHRKCAVKGGVCPECGREIMIEAE